MSTSSGLPRNIMLSALMGTCALVARPAAEAAVVSMVAVPNAWRMETYVGAAGGNNVMLWFTGSPCTNGSLQMSSPSEQDKNRLWATVMAAKLANRRMFVYFDNANAPASCPMISFGMDDQ